jgi:hypothetical protein
VDVQPYNAANNNDNNDNNDDDDNNDNMTRSHVVSLRLDIPLCF